MAKIEKPQIPSRRERIPVSEAARAQARAGMGGERVNSGGGAASDAIPPAAPDPAIPAIPEPASAAAAPVSPVPEPIAAPAPTETAPLPIQASEPSEPSEASTPAATEITLAVAAPVPLETLPVAPAPVAAVAAPAAPVSVTSTPITGAPSARRGRKPAPPDAVLMEVEHSVKIPESVWNDIRLSLVLLPNDGKLPNSIKKYLVEAHKLYNAQLRKQGKLPALPTD